MKKRVLTLMISVLAAVSIAGCGSQISNDNITITQYKGLEIPETDKWEVTPEQIDQTIQAQLYATAKRETITDRPAKEGDIVNIDFTGMIDGVEFEGGKAQGSELELGSGSFIGATKDYKGFEEQVVGHNVGEEFDITVQFPEVYPNNPDMQNKVAVFHIKLNEIIKQTVPELTDEWVKENTEDAKTVEEYKKSLEKNQEKELRIREEKELRAAVLDAFTDKITVKELPKAEVEEQIKNINDYYTSMAEAYNMEFEDFCSQLMGMTKKDYDKQVKEAAEFAVKRKLGCELLAEKKKLVSDELYKEKLKELIKSTGFADENALMESLGKDKVKYAITEEIVADYLGESCVQVEKKKPTSK